LTCTSPCREERLFPQRPRHRRFFTIIPSHYAWHEDTRTTPPHQDSWHPLEDTSRGLFLGPNVSAPHPLMGRVGSSSSRSFPWRRIFPLECVLLLLLFPPCKSPPLPLPSLREILKWVFFFFFFPPCTGALRLILRFSFLYSSKHPLPPSDLPPPPHPPLQNPPARNKPHSFCRSLQHPSFYRMCEVLPPFHFFLPMHEILGFLGQEGREAFSVSRIGS